MHTHPHTMFQLQQSQCCTKAYQNKIQQFNYFIAVTVLAVRY